MLHIALFEPEIPPNTGNIIRLAANTGYALHLIEPLGFPLEDAKLKRAGLDYHEYARLELHQNFSSFKEKQTGRIFACSTKGKKLYSEVKFRAGDILLFGPETRGLPLEILESLPEEQVITLPMRPDSRSLNLSNAVAIVVYESWKQLGFQGGRLP